jgi:hypothetical protein
MQYVSKPVFLLLIVTLLPAAPLLAGISYQFSFQNEPLRSVIQQVQDETSYYFLYRESQIAGIQITLETTADQVVPDLQNVLAREGISLRVDEARNQVFLVRTLASEREPMARRVRIHGQIVDASTGERLPFATLSWRQRGETRGITANASGRFDIQTRLPEEQLIITASYLGYRKRELHIDLAESRRIDDVTLRLEPEVLAGNEIIITAFSGYNPSDTMLTGLMDAGRFSPLGESNSIRALQSHPSVAKVTALNDGIHVRGSTPDGFLVMLDGMRIFNQSHLFGLLDSFNADAIQSAGYYFGVVPAYMDAPTGGTLNLITRTGSRIENRQQVALSNTSISGSFEGPLGNRSSWLVSARTSYMDQVNWFNNSRLVQWGLDIDRPLRVADDTPDFTDLVLQPGAVSVQYLDLHGKLYHETSGNGRFILSGYLGGDRTSQLASRRTRTAGIDRIFTFEEVETSNRWGNALMSLSYQRQVLSDIHSSTTAGFSSYETEFDKDDFVYSRISRDGDVENITIFTFPFRNRSAINEMRVNQEFGYHRDRFAATFGGSWRYYRGEYGEDSFDRPSFFTQSDAHLGNIFLHAEWNPWTFLNLDAGGRFYYFSEGSKVLPAPRFQLRLSPASGVHLTAGYAVNHQFLHKISLQNAVTADVWILSTGSQPPATSTLYSAGFEYTPVPSLYLKAETYLKKFEDLRIHERNAPSLVNTFSGTPWFIQNSGESRGLEMILRNRFRTFTLTHSYTLSEMTFRNPALLDGARFHPEWDRTHTYNLVLEIRIGSNFQWYLSWLMMSGAPNSLATFGSDERERLDAYYRMDTSVSHQWQLSNSVQLETGFSVFNLLNRDNVWYRNYAFSYEEVRSIPRLRPVPVDVLDLGIQPSFRVALSF